MIKVKSVSKCFLSSDREIKHALREVTFEAFPSRIMAILGPNGSGKTTLLRMLAGMLRSDSGQISVDGFELPNQVAEVKSRIGFLTGSATLHKKLTVRETLDLFADLQGIPKGEKLQRVERLVDQFAMQDFYGQLVGGLSLGQKQRLMVARTLLHDPSVIIFDEATSGLDVIAAKTLVEMIKSSRDEGKTVVFATHIMGEVSRLADEVLVLHCGRVFFNGGVESFLDLCGRESVEEGFVRLLEGGTCVESS